MEQKLKVVVLNQEEALATSVLLVRTEISGPIRYVRLPPKTKPSDYYGKLMVTASPVSSPRFTYLSNLRNNPQVFTALVEKKFWNALTKFANLVIVVKGIYEPMPGTRDFAWATSQRRDEYRIMVNTTGKTLDTLKIPRFKGKLKEFVNPNFITRNVPKLQARAVRTMANYPPPLIERLVALAAENRAKRKQQ